MSEKNNKLECSSHGLRSQAFVCQHLISLESKGFWETFDSDPRKEYSDGELNAWCDECDKILLEQGEWNDISEAFAEIKLVCDKCFFEMKELNGGSSKNTSGFAINRSNCMLKTTKRLLIVFLLITILFTLLYGVFRLYEVFYPAYFNQTGYEQTAFIGNTEMPTKYQVLFSGFREVRAMLTSAFFSFLLIYCSKMIRKNRKQVE